MYLTDEQFAEIYNAAPSRTVAARRLGMTFRSMENRVYRINRAGKIKLNKFTWGKPGLMAWLEKNYPDVLAEWRKANTVL